MKVLVTGGGGQLGLCLRDCLKEEDVKAIIVSRKELDITRLEACNETLYQHRPDIIINCAAYTAVDEAERAPDLANQINNIGVRNLATTCQEMNIPLIHISTDYVFDGRSNRPFIESDPTSPKSVYGDSKLKGELAISELLSRFIIIRTSWLYSEYNKNFVKTMIKLAKERDSLSVVNDQQGSPTYALDLARAIVSAVDYIYNQSGQVKKTYHFANEGVCSWFTFANAIFKKSAEIGLIDKEPTVTPVTSEEFKTLAQRPAYSALNSSKIMTDCNADNRQWDEALGSMLCRYKDILDESNATA